MKCRILRCLAVATVIGLTARVGWGQGSPLYMVSSPNVIYPVGTTLVYQGSTLLQQWAHTSPYETSLAVVNGAARQGAVFSGFSGTEYTLTGAPTGTIYPAAPGIFDAASDGNSIFGWDLYTATLKRYDLNWRFQQNVFSLGTAYAYAYMGITFDLQTRSIWLSAWSTGSIDTRGYLYNYSLTGELLGTLPLANPNSVGCGLAYDPAGDTLWFFNWIDQRYEDYNRNGEMVSSLTGMTRIYGAEFEVPEPTVSAVFGIGMLFSAFRLRRKL